jgi:hypothetical protein
MSVILARSEGRAEVTEWDVERGFLDLLEMLDSTLKFVEKKVQVTWITGNPGWGYGKDREMLELLALADATSEESPVSPSKAISKIFGKLWG